MRIGCLADCLNIGIVLMLFAVYLNQTFLAVPFLPIFNFILVNNMQLHPPTADACFMFLNLSTMIPPTTTI